MNKSDNKKGLTPLMYAVRSCSVEVLKFLLEAGADVSQTTKKGYNVLHVAAECNSKGIEEILEILLTRLNDQEINASAGEKSVTPLLVAIANNNKATAKVLFNCPKVNRLAKDIDNQTTLHYAAHTRSKELIELVCSDAEAFTSESSLNQTPLDILFIHEEQNNYSRSRKSFRSSSDLLVKTLGYKRQIADYQTVRSQVERTIGEIKIFFNNRASRKFRGRSWDLENYLHSPHSISVTKNESNENRYHTRAKKNLTNFPFPKK